MVVGYGLGDKDKGYWWKGELNEKKGSMVVGCG